MNKFPAAVVCLAIACASAKATSIWTESFETGVGRLNQTRGPGDTRFVWEASTQSIHGTFVRNDGTVEQRFAELGETLDAYSTVIGFSMVVTPLSGNGQNVRAPSRIGFLHSLYGNRHNMAGINISNGQGGNWISIAGFYESGGEINPASGAGGIPFTFGTTYFVNMVIDGPGRVIVADVYQGESSAGTYLGRHTRALTEGLALRVDSLGLSNVSGGGERVFVARLHEISYTVPAPHALGVIAGAGLVMAARRRR
jgi:hypothetical protein